MKSKHYPTIQLLRYLTLGCVLLFITIIGFLHQADQERFASVDALCPYGGLESLLSILFEGRFLHRVFSSSLILFIITASLVFVTGRSFCGWICPLGTIQGIVNKIKSFFVKKSGQIFYSTDHSLRWGRIIVFVFFTIGAWVGGKLLIRPYDPWVAWMHLSEIDHALKEFPMAVAILAILIIASIFITRPFCRYLCPMGGFLGLLNKLSIFKLQKNTHLCKSCQACSAVCPVGINVQTMDIAPKGECISCGECVDKCKGKMALSFSIGKRNVSTGVTALLVFVIFFGIIGVTKGTGLYSSTPPSIEALKKRGDTLPDHIKGYMSLKEVAYLFDVSLTDLYAELRLNEKVIPSDTNCRDIGGILKIDFETDQVRLAVARLLKIPETEVTQSCSSSGPVFIPGTMTLEEVSSTFKIELPVLYDKLGLSMERIPPTTACRDLKFMVSPDFHTTRVRAAVSELLNN